jgi:hypothetical protein
MLGCECEIRSPWTLPLKLDVLANAKMLLIQELYLYRKYSYALDSMTTYFEGKNAMTGVPPVCLFGHGAPAR